MEAAASVPNVLLVLNLQHVDIYYFFAGGVYRSERVNVAEPGLGNFAKLFLLNILNENISLPAITHTKNQAIVYAATHAGCDAAIFTYSLRNFVTAVEKKFPSPARITFVIADKICGKQSKIKSISSTVRDFIVTTLGIISNKNTRVNYNADYSANVLAGVKLAEPVAVASVGGDGASVAGASVVADGLFYNNNAPQTNTCCVIM